MDDKISITICGDGGCGKSSITLRIVRSQWVHDYDPTIEDSYSVTRTIDGTTYSLGITDTAGQEEYRGMWSAQNLTSDAFLLVYDITNAQSLEAMDFFAELVDVECEARKESGKCWPAIMVAGNKCDLQAMRQVGAKEGLEWAKSRGCGFMETSARELVNIEETFAALVKRVVEARRQHAAGLTPDFPTLMKPVPAQSQAPSAGGGGAAAAAAAAAAPPPMQRSAPGPNITSDAEKERFSQSERDSINRPKKGGFFSSLKCW